MREREKKCVCCVPSISLVICRKEADVADARSLSFLFLSLSPNYLPSIVLANSEASAQLENFSPVIDRDREREGTLSEESERVRFQESRRL